MPSDFSLKQQLVGYHHGGINCVALDDHAELMATGGNDKKLIVWNLQPTAKVLYQIECHSPVLSLAWCRDSSLVIGTEGGTLISAQFDDNHIQLQGFQAHHQPIEFLAVSKAGMGRYWLASAGQSEGYLWFHDHAKKYRMEPMQFKHPEDFENPIVITSLQWNCETSQETILVAYLHQGVYCWNITSPDAEMSLLWKIQTSLCGYANLSQNHQQLAICHINSGFEFYQIPSLTFIGSVEIPEETPQICLPVAHVDGTSVVVVGSETGKVRLFRGRTGKHIQTLHHKEYPCIQTLLIHVSKSCDKIMVITGSSDLEKNAISVWVADVVEN